MSAGMLIGLTGATGAGKDSAAAVLASAGWRTIAFADALRAEAADAWGIDQRLLTERATKEAPMRALAAGGGHNANWLRHCAVNGVSLIEPRSPRWVLQRWGEFRRHRDAAWWITPVRGWIAHQRRHGPAMLAVTDVRMPNEADALRLLGGHIVRVHRPTAAPMAPDTATHESEQHTQLHADEDIHNTGTLADLAAEVWRVVLALQHRIAEVQP